MNDTIAIGVNRSVSVCGSKTVTAAKRIVLEAGDEIVLTVGSSTLVMKKDGSISLNGKTIDAVGADHIALESKRIDMN